MYFEKSIQTARAQPPNGHRRGAGAVHERVRAHLILNIACRATVSIHSTADQTPGSCSRQGDSRLRCAIRVPQQRLDARASPFKTDERRIHRQAAPAVESSSRPADFQLVDPLGPVQTMNCRHSFDEKKPSPPHISWACVSPAAATRMRAPTASRFDSMPCNSRTTPCPRLSGLVP
jgi:hypothetical protein